MSQTRKKILVVEDDDAMRGFVASCLEQSGLTVHPISNGLDALKWLKDEPDADLMVLDLVLPWLNGLELLATLRKDETTRTLPVLVTTGTFVTALQFADDPCVSVLRKPFDGRQLVVAVESMLGGHVV
jgi:two-component system phosphate regulon response regulator PhoB